MGKPKTIVLHVFGTRGDVQPYIALGTACKAAGYEVYILTCENHVPLANESGLNAVGCFCDFEYEMKNNKVLAQSMADGDTITFMKALNTLYAKYAERHIKEWTEAVDEIKPDLIIQGTLTSWFSFYAELHKKIPVVQSMLNVIPPNCQHMVFGFPNAPCGLNKRVIRKFLESAFYDQCTHYDPVCKKMYGIKLKGELLHPQWFWDVAVNNKWGFLLGVSPEVAKVLDPMPAKNWIYCGQFAMSAEEQMQAAQDFKEKTKESGFFGSTEAMNAITEFIDRGAERPVFMGWGSMTAKSPEYMVKLVAEAVKLAGVRAIVYEGWAHMNVETLKKTTQDEALIKYAEENLLFVGKTPHAWLFPLCSCVIHHGGAGTLTTALKAGVPQIITPVWLDQWDHAYFLNQRGCGYGFEKTQLTNLTANEMGAALKKVVGDTKIAAAATAIKIAVDKEPGSQRVIEHIENFWTKSMETGEWPRWIEKSIKDNLDKNSRCCG